MTRNRVGWLVGAIFALHLKVADGTTGMTGRVESLKQIYSSVLKNARDVSVWLPPSYLRNSERRYPVIYQQDGQNAFDPETSYAGVDWGIDEAMTELIAQGEVPEAIVVAVESTDDREAEYDYSQKGSDYADFLIQTLKPLIDLRYRTQPGRESTYLMGSSMGALISATMLFYHSEVFSRAAGLSFPAHYDAGSIFRLLDNSPRPKNIQLYADHGDRGEDVGYEPWVNKLYHFLRGHGYSAIQLQFKKFVGADHNEEAWARRVKAPLRFLLNPPP